MSIISSLVPHLYVVPCWDLHLLLFHSIVNGNLGLHLVVMHTRILVAMETSVKPQVGIILVAICTSLQIGLLNLGGGSKYCL